MSKKPLEVIDEFFSKVNDPRKDRTKEHNLIYIIVIAICAVICGAATIPQGRYITIAQVAKN